MIPSTSHNITAPIIILGMHRSGTSLLTRMLEAIGLFVGRDLQGDHESAIFIQVNNKYFEQTNSSWDNPVYPTLTPTGDNAIGRVFKANLEAIKAQFGPLDGFWGFKDPRSLTTYPLWKDLFPTAKTIYITRSPVDIAKSLTQRHTMLVEKGIFPREGNFTKANIRFTQRCATFEGSLDLALEQIAFADKLKQQSVLTDNLELSYEALMRDPLFQLSRIAGYLGIKPDRDAVLKAVSLPRSDATVETDKVMQAYFPYLAKGA